MRRWDRAEDKNGGWLDWRVNRRYSLSLYPLLNEPVDFFSVNYTKDENSVIGSFENHPVISNSQLPESFKGSLQWFSIDFRSYDKPFFDGSLDHFPVFYINLRDV